MIAAIKFNKAAINLEDTRLTLYLKLGVYNIELLIEVTK